MWPLLSVLGLPAPHLEHAHGERSPAQAMVKGLTGASEPAFQSVKWDDSPLWAGCHEGSAKGCTVSLLEARRSAQCLTFMFSRVVLSLPCSGKHSERWWHVLEDTPLGLKSGASLNPKPLTAWVWPSPAAGQVCCHHPDVLSTIRRPGPSGTLNKD